jgi:hypothetical protein
VLQLILEVDDRKTTGSAFPDADGLIFLSKMSCGFDALPCSCPFEPSKAQNPTWDTSEAKKYTCSRPDRIELGWSREKWGQSSREVVRLLDRRASVE